MDRKASYFSVLPNNAVRCELCPHQCRIQQNKSGICLTRSNSDGTLVSSNYCRPVSAALDPIEKKPLYHFYPGSHIFSTGPSGCPFKCEFCQNHEISQQLISCNQVSTTELVNAAMQHKSIGIAYTYSEPTIWFETIIEVGNAIKNAGLKNVMISNGYINPRPLAELSTIIDAWNIDIKSIRPQFYRRYCKARLEPVLKACEQVKKNGHLEITNLLIPGLNDAEQEIADLTLFIATNLGPDTPLHFSRYTPRYKLSIPATPQKTVLKACAIAREHLWYVYAGNISASPYDNTHCPECKTVLIERRNHTVKVNSRIEPAQTPSKFLTCNTCSFITTIII